MKDAVNKYVTIIVMLLLLDAESRWKTEWLSLTVYDLKAQVKRHHEMIIGGLPKNT